MKIFDCIKSEYEFRKPLYVDNSGELVLGRYEDNSEVSLFRYNNGEYTQLSNVKNVYNSDEGTFIISAQGQCIIFLRKDETDIKLIECDVESQIENLIVSLNVQMEYTYEDAFDTNNFIVLVFHNFNTQSYILHIVKKKSYEVETITILSDVSQISVNEVEIDDSYWFIIKGKYTLPENDIRNFYCTDVYIISLEDIKLNKQVGLKKYEVLQSYKYKDYLMQDGSKLYFAVNTGYLRQTIIDFDLHNIKVNEIMNKQNILFIGQSNNDYYFQEVISEETHIRSILNRNFDIKIKDNIKQAIYIVTPQNVIFSNLPFRGSVIVYDVIASKVVYEKNFDEVDIPIQTMYLEESDSLVIY